MLFNRYVRDGKYHLVTNCREIAARFLQCGQGERTLADSKEFRYARSLIPLGEENTIFVYLSRKFFEGLLSPQYQIETERRLRLNESVLRYLTESIQILLQTIGINT